MPTEHESEIVSAALRFEAAQSRSDQHEMGHALLDLVHHARLLRKQRETEAHTQAQFGTRREP